MTRVDDKTGELVRVIPDVVVGGVNFLYRLDEEYVKFLNGHMKLKEKEEAAELRQARRELEETRREFEEQLAGMR